MLDVFKVRFAQLTKKAKGLFMEGKITLGKAYLFSTQRHRFRKMQLEDLVHRHVDPHARMLESLPFINYPIRSVEELMDELAQHPRAIARAISCGQLTLVQARFAKERSFGAKRLASIIELNRDDLITTPLTRPIHKAPRDRLTVRRPASRQAPRSRR